MTQGIFAALEHLEERIMSINPKTDTHSGFVAIQRDDGLSVELEERSNNNRYFEFQIDRIYNRYRRRVCTFELYCC